MAGKLSSQYKRLIVQSKYNSFDAGYLHVLLKLFHGYKRTKSAMVSGIFEKIFSDHPLWKEVSFSIHFFSFLFHF